MGITELRVGNWVLLEGEWNQVSRSDFEYSNDHLFEPIRITTSILLSIGFTKYAIDGFYILPIGNDTYLMSGGDTVWVEKVIRDDGYSVGLGGASFIHQLQNLYHSLTLTELTITNDNN